MEQMIFCQSCAMPLNEEDMGTNSDGTKCREYCQHCYGEGKFLHECTMGEMIEQCVPFVSGGAPYSSPEEARAAMQELFPKLKRWGGSGQ